MHPYTMLKKIVEESGAILSEEDVRPDVFGSAWAVYSRGQNRIRLVWDGKDGCGVLQRPVADGWNWENASSTITEGDLEGRSQNESGINLFRESVRQLLLGK